MKADPSSPTLLQVIRIRPEGWYNYAQSRNALLSL